MSINLRLAILSTAAVVCLPSLAQQATVESIDQEQCRAIATAMQPYTQGIRTGKIAVDSSSVTKDSVKVFLNSALEDIPMRKDNVAAITDAVRTCLPADLKGRKLEVLVNGHEISSLIPNYYREKKERRASFENAPANTTGDYNPIVSNNDKPYAPKKGLAGRHIAMWQSHGKYFEQGLNRWEWQRSRLFESVEDKFTQSFVLPYLVPMLENAGAYVMMPRERDTNPAEVIVDNDGKLATSFYKEANGKEPWQQGGTGFAYARKQYVDFQNPFTEGTYRQTTTTKNNKEEEWSTVTWTPDIPKSGRYAVYVSYKTLPGSTDDAHYTVLHDGLATHFTVNQTMGGGTWIYLGTFHFTKGFTGNGVMLDNHSKTAGKTVTADAVKFGGGMGNIARATDGDKLKAYTKGNRTEEYISRNEYQPALQYVPAVSGYPRYLEGSRYYLQWAGIPDSIYSPSHGTNDYTDDYKDRGIWVNYLMGGTRACPDYKGLNIPIDLSFAFHSDAGTVNGDSIIGNLGIYQTSQYGGVFADGSSRDANRDLCDIVQSSITHDVRMQAEPKWTRRGMWSQRYFEAWVPRVPAMLLELMSHENFADMRYGLDPRFRFIVSRAIYKGILRFLATEHGYDYVVQPLPVKGFSAMLNDKQQAVLSWQAVSDSLEPTAEAKRFIVYKRIGNGDFDNGTVVKKNTYTIDIPRDQIVSFKVTALNDGGESFPSEILSVGINSKADKKPVLVINGFDRLSAPDDFRSSDDALAGFLADYDNGVADKQLISYVGAQKEFRRGIPWTHDDASGFGDSYGNYERITIAGNTFDYPALHGSSIMKAGYSFVSTSRSAIEEAMTPKNELAVISFDGTHDFSAIDLILGKEKQSKFGREGLHPLSFKTFDYTMQKLLTDYCKAGGPVFVSGSYVGTDLWQNPLVKGDKDDQEFAKDILKYQWREDRAATTGDISYIVSPLASDTASFTYYNKPNSESYVVESPDAIDPACPEAYTAFRYPENGMSAGIVFGGNATDKWRTCVLAFPFEAVKSEAARDTMMKRILNYLLK